ncbi:MAG: ATP-binding protein [Promethearchaeota archaeon]|jgi:Pyruvate/2-oxoacid:ferredoxin oxidoreductase delta subunit
MTEVDYYEVVRQKLKLGKLYAPKHKKVIELLKIFWNEEEIKILSQFEGTDKDISLKKLEEKTEIPRGDLKIVLRNLRRKGTIARRGSRYCLLPLLPGIFEKYFIHLSDSEENLKKVAEIYRYLFKNFVPQFFSESKFKLFRPLLPYEAKEKLIEINQSFDVESKVLPYELVEDVINKYDTFCVVPCQCRIIGEYTGESCKVAPPELGCFLAGSVAEVALRKGRKKLTKEEAIEFLKKTEKAGLVHNCIMDTSIESSLYICNCCSCHCGGLISSKEHRENAVITSNFLPKFDNQSCTKCEICLNKCPMGAIYHRWANEEDKSDEIMYIREEFCIGCGVCAANCPNNSIKLVKIKDHIPKEKYKIGNRTFLELIL